MVIDALCSRLAGTFCEIDQLAAILLRFCREYGEQLRLAYDHDELCTIMYDESDVLQVWFEDELHEDWLDQDELTAVNAHLRRIAVRVNAAGFPDQAAVVAARAMAEALDHSHGRRFARGLRGRGVTDIAAGDPLPIVHPPLKELFARELGTNPLALGPQMHELRWLRLMPDVARGHQVRLDFRHQDVLADLRADTRIAVAIPSDVSALCFDTSAGPRFFGVRPRQPAEQSASILRLLEQAAAGGARIVVLPELCLDQDGLDAIRAWHAHNRHDIAITVCGSTHGEREGQRRNVSITLLPDGSEIEHYKFNPFYLSLPDEDGTPVNHREDIVTTPSIITIQMCADWSFTTLICKDFLEPGVAQILEEAQVRLVLVPACSPKTGVFVQVAGMLAVRAQAVVVIANLADPGAHDPDSAIVARPLRRDPAEAIRRSRIQPPQLLFFDFARLSGTNG
jgi:hypothetical protein